MGVMAGGTVVLCGGGRKRETILVAVMVEKRVKTRGSSEERGSSNQK